MNTTTATLPANWPKKFAKLPVDHPTVLRRWVRELSHRPAGFYWHGQRFNQARVKAGRLQVRMCDGAWTDCPVDDSLVIGDGSGGTVCVSRTVCGY